MLSRLFPLAIVALLCALRAAPAQDKKDDTPSDIILYKDLVYGTGGGVDLRLDLAVPRKVKGLVPAVVCIHGGGWKSGDRRAMPMMPLVTWLAQRGFVAATISYRLAPKYTFPAQIEDANAAVRWLRAHAAEYGIDKDNIGAMGFSAGGHLSCLLGTADAKAGLEGKGGNPDQSSRVQAVVSFFGPTDFIGHAGDPKVSDVFLIPFLGGPYPEKKDVYALASPLMHVSPDDPPFLFFHGDKDPLVHVSESLRLAKKLEEAGVEARVVVLKGMGHGWFDLNMIMNLKDTMAFFEKKLKR